MTTELRRAKDSDVHLFHRWANDPEVRQNAFSSEPIPLPNHIQWFAARLADPDSRIYVLEEEGMPVGQIRFDRNEDGVEIDFSLDSIYRGRGLGRELLARGMEAFRATLDRDAVFIGTVKESNPASAKAFLTAGFALKDSTIIKGEPCLIFRKHTTVL